MTPFYGQPQWSLDGAWFGNVTDDDGIDWVVTTEDGWRSSPPLRADSEPLPGGDGGYDPAPLYGPRTVTLSGTAVCPSDTVRRTAERTFSALLQEARGGVLSCTEDGLTLSCVVRPSGQMLTRQQGSYAFDWQMTLVAPDPRKYGPEYAISTSMAGSSGGLTFPVTFPAAFGTSVGGIAPLPNEGSVKSWPVLRIVGPCVNPRVTNPDTGDELWVNLSLGAGEYLDIDTAARTVLLQGSASRRSKTSSTGEWVPVPPGGASLRFSATTYSPSAYLTVSTRSAWI